MMRMEGDIRRRAQPDRGGSGRVSGSNGEAESRPEVGGRPVTCSLGWDVVLRRERE